MRKTVCRIFALLLSALVIADAALAAGFDAPELYRDPESALFHVLKKSQDWVIVTKENLNEHEATVTACGDSMENVRFRFEHGDILLEAYHPDLPNGRIRLQAFDNEFTRSVWHLDDLTKKEYIAAANELKEKLFDGYLYLFNIKYYAEYAKGRDFRGSVIAYPPYPYESGLFRLEFFNGKAYLLTYTQPTQGSAKKLLGGDHTYDRLYDWTALGGKGVLQDTVERQTAPADLRTDTGRLILNAHSGVFEMTGITEKKAKVTLHSGESTWEADVDADGKYRAQIRLVPGENEIVAVAQKPERRENTLSRVISVHDDMAALELTEYPDGLTERDKLRVAGKASPGAEVTVQIDGEAPQTLTLKADGSFKTDLTAEDWVQHTVTVTAKEAGLSDCSARFSFASTYDDAKKGISAYKKTLSAGLTAKKLSANPAAYVGDRIKMEVYTTKAERLNGQLVLTGNIESDKNRPVILVCDDYFEDQILDKMKLTVYGEIIEPALTEPPVPRVQVAYISYLKTVYHPRRY